MSAEATLTSRLQRIDQVIQPQRAFLHRVPDPDTRERAESHLFQLMEMREQLAQKLDRGTIAA